jgi:hypothetical protein
MLHLLRRGSVALGLLVILGGWAPFTVAHDKGVLKLANRRLVAGGSVQLVGEKFPKASKLVLLISGAAGRTQLAEVRTDTTGAFRAAPLMPAHLAPGAYRLVVLADDGDEVAGVDVEVVAAVADQHPAGHGEGSPEPSAEPLALERARSPWVTGGAWAVVIATFAAGGLLLRRPAV